MLHRLQRHPLQVSAHFRHCLVLTYALPAHQLIDLMPPGLRVEQYEDLGFIAAALVDTQDLRPQHVPRCLGLGFILAGFRVFARFPTAFGERRGLRILRSLTNGRLMQWTGNLLTHYDYRHACVQMEVAGQHLVADVRTRDGNADLHVTVDLASRPAPLPEGSPFPDLDTARRFAGPLPWTFDYERESHSIIQVKGERDRWNPEPVAVEVTANTFLEQRPFRGAALASAFYIDDVRYRWRRGIVTALPREAS